MTKEEILALEEKEFKIYIGTERNKAVDRTLKIQMDDLNKQKNELEQSVVTLKQEVDDALDNTNTEAALAKGEEIKALENKIEVFEKSIERLLMNNETLVIIDRERIDELSNLVRIYYARKIRVPSDEFNAKLQTLIPVKNEADRLNNEAARLLTGFSTILGKGNIHPNSMLSVDERNALNILMNRT